MGEDFSSPPAKGHARVADLVYLAANWRAPREIPR